MLIQKFSFICSECAKCSCAIGFYTDQSKVISKTCLKWPLSIQDRLLLKAGQKEHSAILSACIKLPVDFNAFFLVLSGVTQVLLIYYFYCT